MSHREGYKEGIPSVTELLRWGGVLPDYPNDPTGYYFRRGKFVDQCCAILARGLELDQRTFTVAAETRKKPSAENQWETWSDYVPPFANWLEKHLVTFIAAQQYVYNPWETYQGTLDLLLEVDGVLTLIDLKTGDCPKATALQTAGYAMALDGAGIRTRPRRVGLQLQPGKLMEHPYSDYKNYDDFRLLCRWYHRHFEYK